MWSNILYKPKKGKGFRKYREMLTNITVEYYIITLVNYKDLQGDKGLFKYYVITLGGGAPKVLVKVKVF